MVAIILGVIANKQIKENTDNFASGSSKMAKAGINSEMKKNFK